MSIVTTRRMGVVPMKKHVLVIPQSLEADVFDVLQDLGVTHIQEMQKDQDIHSDGFEKASYNKASIEFAVKFLKDYTTTKQTLKEKIQKLPLIRSKQDITRILHEEKWNKIVKQCEQAEKRFAEIKQESKDTEQQQKDLAPWMTLSIFPKDTKHTTTRLVAISEEALSELQKALEDSIPAGAMYPATSDSPSPLWVVTVLKEQEKALEKLLEEQSIETLSTETIPEHPQAVFAELTQKQHQLDKEKEQLEKDLNTLANTSIDDCKTLFDYFSWQLEKEDNRRHVLQTEYVSIVTAWIPEEHTKKVSSAMKKVDASIICEEIEPEEEEKAPVALKNHPFIEPFETVMGIYGLPQYHEIDPTPFFAPFFIVFFATCITDAGYGIVMAVGSVLAIIIFKIPRDKQKLFRLLAYGGVLTFIIGAFFGGWFGVTPDVMPDGFAKNLLTTIWAINPVEDTLLFMVLAFAVGVLQAWYAQIIKAFWALKYKDIGGALEGFGWMFTIPVAIGWIAAGMYAPELKTVLGYASLAGLLALVLVYGRSVKAIPLKPLVGVIQVLQGIIGLVSDILSYSRLMALGLATGIIAFIINTIGAIFRDLIPVIGGIVYVLILIGGHTFNLAINALGAFIHSGRLQFVEFFPKFMEGGGKAFTPLSKKSTYINYSQDSNG
ncbi:MAG: hypothetical protein HN802_00650 [Candidatus Jacksonbacteria bacterium]|nr:hypothetical protein [Candidatus Jacksonbacteria bacterium]